MRWPELYKADESIKNRAAYLKLAVWLHSSAPAAGELSETQQVSSAFNCVFPCAASIFEPARQEKLSSSSLFSNSFVAHCFTILPLHLFSLCFSKSFFFDCPLISQPVSSTLSFSGSVSIFIYPSPSIHLHPSLHHVLSAPCCCFIHLPLSFPFFLSSLSLSVTFYIPLNLSCWLVFCLSVGLFYISFRPFVG